MKTHAELTQIFEAAFVDLIDNPTFHENKGVLTGYFIANDLRMTHIKAIADAAEAYNLNGFFTRTRFYIS